MERNIIKIDEAGLKDDLKTLIRGTVEDTLNAIYDSLACCFFTRYMVSYLCFSRFCCGWYGP